jgi:hypothetical protein
MLRGVRFVLPAAAQFVEDFCDRALAVVQKRAAVDTRDRLVAQPSLQVVLSLLGGFTELAQRALVATIVVERLALSARGRQATQSTPAVVLQVEGADTRALKCALGEEARLSVGVLDAAAVPNLRPAPA